jgi:hypothetical protein
MKEVLDSIPIENNFNILSWICYQIPHEDGHLLNRNNKNYFKKILGKQYTTMNLEFRNWIWVIDFKEISFNIFCSTRGSSYEIIGKIEDLFINEEKIKDFLLFIVSKLKEIN